MALQRLVDFLIAARWPLFALAMLLAGLAWWPSRQVRFDRSVENMFAASDPLLPPYKRLKDDFGGNEIVLAVYEDPNLLAADGSGMNRLTEISGKMREVAGVRDVLSLAQVNELLEQLARLKSGGGLFNLFGSKPTWKGPAILNPDDPLAAKFRELFAGYTHSANGRLAAVVCMLEPPNAADVESDVPLDPRTVTIAKLETIVNDLPGSLAPGVIAGEPFMVSRGFALLEEDGRRLGIWSTILLGLTILICFRSLRWLIAPIAVVQWSLLLTRATLVWSGLQLSMVSSMLTAIVTVVGVAGVMHLIVHIREYRTQGLSPRDALRTAGVLLGGAMLGAILTDMAGFGSLFWASVGPVRDFGVMMVVGAALVLPAILLLVPAIALLGANDTGPTKPGWGEHQLGRALMRSVDWLEARPKTIAATLLVLCGLAAIGAYRLEVETDFTRNFRRGSDVVESYAFVETNLGGAGVWDVVIPAPATLNEAYLARVRRLEDRLRKLELPAALSRTANDGNAPPRPALTKVLSLADALDITSTEPLLAAIPVEVRAETMRGMLPVFMSALRTAEVDEHGQGRLRIMLRARERQPAEHKRWLIDEVTRLAQEEFPTGDNTRGAEVTGFFVLLTSLIESMLRDQWTTFAISIIAISLMVWIGFRSWKYALIALVPNVVPIYVVMGLMGWIGLLGIADLKINMGSAMIAAVSMGMTVDSSIHYFASFRQSRRAGKTVHQSLLDVQQSVGAAMIFSTFALIVGFGVLITSDFVPTIYFGALMSLAMLGGMLGNLIVLPLLLAWIERDKPALATLTRNANDGETSSSTNPAAATPPAQTPTPPAEASPDQTN